MSTEPTSHPDLPVSSEGVGHTPGPWRAFNEFGNRGGCFASDNRTLIADVRKPGAQDRYVVPHHDEIDANFRLIAAAPDLLTALEHAVSSQPLDDSCESWVPAARAAISQATRSEPST